MTRVGLAPSLGSDLSLSLNLNLNLDLDCRPAGRRREVSYCAAGMAGAGVRWAELSQAGGNQTLVALELANGRGRSPTTGMKTPQP